MKTSDHAAMLERAAYYRWSAARNDVLPGGDPQTGRPRAKSYVFCDYQTIRESRAAYLAMARVCVVRAREIRTRA